jgi:hypothetical protein
LRCAATWRGWLRFQPGASAHTADRTTAEAVETTALHYVRANARAADRKPGASAHTADGITAEAVETTALHDVRTNALAADRKPGASAHTADGITAEAVETTALHYVRASAHTADGIAQHDAMFPSVQTGRLAPFRFY